MPSTPCPTAEKQTEEHCARVHQFTRRERFKCTMPTPLAPYMSDQMPQLTYSRQGRGTKYVDHATALPRDQSPEGDWLNGLMAEQQRLFPKIALLQLDLPGTCAPSIAAGISAGLLSPLARSAPLSSARFSSSSISKLLRGEERAEIYSTCRRHFRSNGHVEERGRPAVRARKERCSLSVRGWATAPTK